jgi:hypothetical protein
MDKIRTNGLFLFFVNDGCNLEISKDGPVKKVGRVIRTFLLCTRRRLLFTFVSPSSYCSYFRGTKIFLEGILDFPQ